MDWVADANTDENGDTIGDVPQPILNLEDLDMHADEHGDPTENPPQPILNLENLAESATSVWKSGLATGKRPGLDRTKTD